jgi:hypothetical protein
MALSIFYMWKYLIPRIEATIPGASNDFLGKHLRKICILLFIRDMSSKILIFFKKGSDPLME